VDLARTLEKLKNQFPNFKTLRGPIGTGNGKQNVCLIETTLSGPNPGALRMFSYVPADLPGAPALVVVLHGGLQTAASYDLGAGWSTLADRYGFALLMPEQQRANNALSCFNWFQPGDIERGKGECASIRQMVEQMTLEHGIDPSRVFITGLSAGGAMTSVMLAVYPKVFAAGAVIAGLPHGAATTVQEAFHVMAQAPPRSSREWGDRVRGASTHKGPWPKISVWHGSADETVSALNADAIIKQWTDVHGLSIAPTSIETVDGFTRQVWRNSYGEVIIETYTVPGMGHGTPLGTGGGDQQCGAAGPYLLEVGVSSSYHIAKFFGLTGAVRSTAKTKKLVLIPSFDPATQKRAADRHDVDERRTRGHSQPIDIGAVISKALTAAGLLKSQ
jgi:poly(hydroxyalkanoate) depolymerase family esterase